MIAAIGGYRILEAIGTGGLGDVFRARDTRHGRTVAIKLVPKAVSADPELRARLLADARQVAALSHPGIATLYEVGEENDDVFLVFDFVAGEPLQRLIGGRPLNPRRAADFAAQLADGLAEAHAAGVVHGDLSSANVVVTPRGTAKMLDCGLAGWTNGGRRRSAQAPLGERADVAALGDVLFEMLTGRRPAGGVARPAALNKAVHPDLDAVVVRTLSDRADDEYAAASAAADLRAVVAMLDERTDASAQVAAVRPRAARRAGRGWILPLLLIAGLAVVGWLIYTR